MARGTAVFPTVRSEGGLLPPLQRIVEADHELGGFAPADLGLGPRVLIPAKRRLIGRPKTFGLE